MYLLLVQHLHFLRLALVVSLRGGVLRRHPILVVPALLIQATRVLGARRIVSRPLRHWVTALHVVDVSALGVLGDTAAILILLV